MRGMVAAAVLLGLVGCEAITPIATDIPIGGVRAEITKENLVAARNGMPSGLFEPGWLPNGFVLVNADYDKRDDGIVSVDLVYEAPGHQLHIWQTRLTPQQMGESDPVRKGEVLEGTSWYLNRLPAAQVGRDAVVEYARRLDDGRTVSVDTDLDADTMRQILESLRFRGPDDNAR